MPLIQMPLTREEWLAMRRSYVGASEIAALFDCQPDYALSRYALHHVKAGLAPEPDVSNERTKWGLKLEEVIATAAAEERGWTVRRGRYAVCDDCSGLAASLDFEIENDPTGEFQGPGVLETKNTAWLQHRRAWTSDEPPLHILLQLQAQLAATGWNWGAIAALVDGNDLKLYPYAARPKLIADIKSRVRTFWQAIHDREPPAIDGTDSSGAVLKAMFDDPVDDIADLETDEAMAGLCADFLRAGAEKKAAEKARDLAMNRIVEQLGNYRKARVPGFFVNLSVGQDTPDRAAKVGEIIKGRRGARTLHVKETAA